MTLKEGGRDPKQNPSPPSLTSLLTSAQTSPRLSPVLESPFPPTRQKLLTHIIKATKPILKPLASSPSSEQVLLWQRHYSVRGEPWKILLGHFEMWLPLTICHVPPMERRLPTTELAGGASCPHLRFACARGGSAQESAFSLRKWTESFDNWGRGIQLPSGSSSPGVGWTSEEGWIGGRTAVCSVNESQDSAINSSSQENMPPCQPTHHPIKQTNI